MRNILVKRNDYNPFNLIDSFFSDYFNTENDSVQNPLLRPSVDIKEDEKSIHVEAELPGLNEKDIDIQIEKGILTIKGEKIEEKQEKIEEKQEKIEEKQEKIEENEEKQEAKEDQAYKYHRVERRYGSFERSFKLPDYVKSEDAKASYKNGILKLEIPKEEAKAPKKLKIEVES